MRRAAGGRRCTPSFACVRESIIMAVGIEASGGNPSAPTVDARFMKTIRGATADAARPKPIPALSRLPGGQARTEPARPAGTPAGGAPPAATFSFGTIAVFPPPRTLQLSAAPGRPGGAGERGGPGGALQAAAAGVRGAGGAVPYREEMEHSLGVSLEGIRAHTESDARTAAARLGAYGYATGNHVVFGTAAPSRRLVAHEVTHVLQQRRGVHLDGGMGRPDDPYEREAERAGELVESGRSARHIGRAYAGTGPGASGPAAPVAKTPLNGMLRAMLGAPARPHAPVQFDLRADLRGMLDIIGPPHYEGVVQAIHAAPVAERQAAVTDSATLDLIRQRFTGVYATTIMSSLLEGSQNWANPPQTDFYTFFVLNRAAGTPPTTRSTMNCWESILYAAWLAGVLSAAWIRNYYVSAGAVPNTTVDPTPALWAQLGFSTSLPTYHPSAGATPTVGQLVFYLPAGSAIPSHVAVSLGGGEVMSLWTRPNNVTQVQRIPITAIAGTIYYGNPPW